MRLNIGIDIDGTITDPYQWLDLINRYFKLDLKPEDVIAYHVEDYTDITKEQFRQFMTDCGEEMCSTAIPRDKAVSIFNRIHSRHNVHIITAREESTRGTTEKWMKNHGIKYSNLHMLGSHDKLKKAKELQCDLFLEDRYETALELALSGIKVLLLDANYNRQPLIPGITRVYDWNDVENEVEYILQKKEKFNNFTPKTIPHL